MSPREPTAISMVAQQVTLRGDLQGLGIRPRIACLAESIGVAGFVRNTNDGVLVHVEGDSEQVDAFLRRLSRVLPDHFTSHSTPTPAEHLSFFEILDSTCDAEMAAQVPPDRALCAHCLSEGLLDADARRGEYPFITCACCGPRYSILEAMPFDRPRTAMRHFPPCEDCLREYDDPRDRRRHAETISCSRCGPRLWITDGQGRLVDSSWRDAGRSLILEGKILALRGVGGYQLIVDATNPDAVRRLRANKRRRYKPLAVLVADVEIARECAWLDDAERQILESPSNPIVILRARSDSPVASTAVHPGTNNVGVMLPTTLLHALISRDVGRPLVCTSGNREGDAIETDPDTVLDRLTGVADLWIHHDRPILHAIDDSVVRLIARKASTLRLARGLAPLPLHLPTGGPPILATGGQMKSSLAWHNSHQACLGPHVGDLDSVHVAERYLSHVADVESLYRFTPTHRIFDAHPDYATRTFFSEKPTNLYVQHHHAHVVSAMLEADMLDREVLGVAWDGTGFGTDSSVWGGEFLRATVTSAHRVAGLLPFRLPGGESAIHEPWRIALSMTLPHQLVDPARLQHLFGRSRVEQAKMLLDRPAYSPWCSSVGRLFDVVAWLLLGEDAVGYDGRAGTLLESIADLSEPGAIDTPLIQGETCHWLDWRPLIRAIFEQVEMGIETSTIAMRFHRSLAKAVLAIADRHPKLPVVLAGGVFQNRLLVELIAEAWHDPGNSSHRRGRLITPGSIPVNDGGLSAGQLAIACMTWQNNDMRRGSPSCA